MSTSRRLRLARTAAILLVVVGLVTLGVRLASHAGAGAGASHHAVATPAAATPAAPTTTTTPAPTTTTPALAGVLADHAVETYLRSCDDDITAAVYDVATSTTSYWRPGITEDEASIAKVDILAALLRHRPSLGADDLDTATTMIEDSDDTSANELWEQLGEGPVEAAFNRRIGLTDTTPGSGIYWGLTTTTAADQVRLLRAVALGTPLLSAASRHLELGLMEHVDPSQAWGVSSGLAAGTSLAIKNGWLPLEAGNWQVNSIGWVHGDGRDYLIAVLTDHNTSEYQGITTIEHLSDLVWSAGG